MSEFRQVYLASGESFKEALDAARSVLADENATQKQVDSAYTTLQKAIFGHD
ncbi:MAG: hypothetical protein ACLTCI_08405 [[Clostridium] nexile]